MGKKNSIPIYLQVAVDVASRIRKKELVIGQKISGRTTLASEYNVSPETIRKAMKLLSEVNIVEVKRGNGVHVLSVSRAKDFIENYQIKTNVNELKDELLNLMKQRDEIEEKMNDTMKSIIDYTSRFKNSSHIRVYEYCINYGKVDFEITIAELNLKKNTGIDLIGIVKDGRIMLSPNSDEVVNGTDKLLYVGISDFNSKLDEYIQSIYEKNAKF
ncbi:MAG: GntR family transcriptional regulator [Bacillota bacterium]|nr:GntR family transcriptional regulator [Bacillota bacterium]